MLEYLILNGKSTAAKHFNDNKHTSLREQLMTLFNKGNRLQFMELFNMLHKQSKLQFYLRVYFLIYSIHPVLKGKNSIPEPEKIAFKDYLDNRGSELAKTTQFLQFYALPFIKNPLQHLAFKNLFKKQWLTNLKQKLQIFITEEERILKSQIAKVFQNHTIQIPTQQTTNTETKLLQDRIKQMQKINKKLFQQVKQFTQKYHILQKSHKDVIQGYHMHMMQSQSKWFQITKQLVGCSKQLIKKLIQQNSDCLNDRKFIKIKKKIQKYQRFVNKKFDDLVSHSEDISIFDRPSISDMSYTATHKNFHTHTQNLHVQQYIPTDFQALKAFLKKASAQQKISIVTGLFWRIVKSKSKQIRKLNIVGILHYDVLGIKTGEIQQMLASKQLMKHVVRLIQIISLDNNGKKIAFTTNLIKDFVGLISQCQDPSCFQYIIGTLGQISSQKLFKLKLIQQDVIEICVSILRSNKYSNNQVILENTIAIMLNMLQIPQGLNKYQKQKDIFQILKNCLYNNYKMTRTLIYGIIFALLESQQLFKIAHAQKLPQFFNNILSIDPNINRTQLKYLKNKLVKFQPKQMNDQNQQQDDYENQEQGQEDYEIQEQYITQLDQMLKLNDQILKKFALKGKEAVQQARQVKEVLEQYRGNRLPSFHSPKQQKTKIGNPKPSTNVSEQKPLYTPYLKQNIPQPVNNTKLSEVSKKINNFIELQPEQKPKELNNIKIRQRPTKNIDKKPQQVENYSERDRDRRMKKSVSADRGISYNIENIKNYQSSKNNNKISEFKAMEQRQKNYRSPPQKRPRQQVLKQLNEQIKAKQMLKKQRNLQHQRENNSAFISDRNKKIQQYSQVFQSKPKLRRTPPRQ